MKKCHFIEQNSLWKKLLYNKYIYKYRGCRKMNKKSVIHYSFNYNKLLGKIKEVFHTQEKYAQALGIGRVSVSQRLNNKLEFSQNEILKSCKLLGISKLEMPSYFFNVEENMK